MTDIDLRGKVHFKAAVVAMSVKPCKVICPWHTFQACNLTLTYFSHSNDFDINLFLCSNDSCQTSHSKCTQEVVGHLYYRILNMLLVVNMPLPVYTKNGIPL